MIMLLNGEAQLIRTGADITGRTAGNNDAIRIDLNNGKKCILIGCAPFDMRIEAAYGLAVAGSRIFMANPDI